MRGGRHNLMRRWGVLPLVGLLGAVLLVSVGLRAASHISHYLPLIVADSPIVPRGDLFVSPTGSDDNDGRTPTHPLRTLALALEIARPGETVLLLPGTYTGMTEVYDVGDGTAPITITGQSPEHVIFDGSGMKGAAFQCWSCRGVTLENVTIQNYAWGGVGIFFGQDITLRHLRIVHSGFTIHPDVDDGGGGIIVVESSDVLIEQVSMAHIGLQRVEQEISGNGVNMWRCRDCTVRSVDIRDVLGTGILVEESCRVLVEDNRVTFGKMDMDTWWDSGVWLDGGQDVTVRANVFEHNDGPGIQVSDSEAVYPQASRQFVVEDNVSRFNRVGLYVWNYGVCPAPEDALRLHGNRFSDNQQGEVSCLSWACGEGQPCVPADGPPVSCQGAGGSDRAGK